MKVAGNEKQEFILVQYTCIYCHNEQTGQVSFFSAHSLEYLSFKDLFKNEWSDFCELNIILKGVSNKNSPPLEFSEF
jgi:hypothetical protein